MSYSGKDCDGAQEQQKENASPAIVNTFPTNRLRDYIANRAAKDAAAQQKAQQVVEAVQAIKLNKADEEEK